MWKEIDGKPEKKKYEDLAAADKVRYNNELSIYKDMLAEMDDEERAEYDAENNLGSGSAEEDDLDEDDENSKKKKKKKKQHKKEKKERKEKKENKKHGTTTMDDVLKKNLTKPSIGSHKKENKEAAAARSMDIDVEEEEEAEQYGSSEDEKETKVSAQDSLPPSTQYNSEDEEMHAAKLMKEEEEEEKACMTLAVSPSASPSKTIDQTSSKKSTEDSAASLTPEKELNNNFVFSKPALPTKPSKHAKHDVSHKVKSGEKLAHREFLTPSIGSSGSVKPKKNGFSVPKKNH